MYCLVNMHCIYHYSTKLLPVLSPHVMTVFPSLYTRLYHNSALKQTMAASFCIKIPNRNHPPIINLMLAVDTMSLHKPTNKADSEDTAKTEICYMCTCSGCKCCYHRADWGQCCNYNTYVQ